MVKVLLSWLAIMTGTMVAAQVDVFDAARAGDTIALQQAMVEGLDINAVNEEGFSSLILAGYKGHTDCAKWLVNHGADINLLADEGTILHGVLYKNHIRLAEWLLQKGANPNLQDQNGSSGLIYAVLFNRNSLLPLMLENGADKNLKDRTGQSALDYAKQLNPAAYTILNE